MAQKAEIRGFLYDKKTGEAILYAPVFLKGTSFGTATDVNGYFSINRIEPGNYTLTAINLGYDTLYEEVTLAANQHLSRKLLLSESLKELETVEVIGKKNEFRRQNTVNVSLTQITPNEIRVTPSVGGEADILQYIQTLPGVVSTGDQGGQVYIRGGTLTQNLSLLDGMILYNPFHSIGLYSVFDTDILKNADFYTAGFGPEYGGRASSVIDARTIDGNKNKHTIRASLNPVASKFSANGPILTGRNGASLTYIVSARRSNLAQTGKSLYKYATTGGRSLNFNFEDFYTKFTVATPSGSKFSAFAFSFNDDASIGVPNNVEWTNTGGGGSFVVLPGSGSTLITGNFGISNYKINIKEKTNTPRKSEVGGFNFGLDLTYYIGKSELKYGIGVLGNNTSYVSPLPTTQTNATGEATNSQIIDFTAFNSEFFGYFKYRINLPHLIIDPGFRLHYYASLGIPSPEPRLGIKWSPSSRLRFKGAIGRYSQNLISTRSDRDVVNLFAGFVSSPEQVSNAQGARIDKPIQIAWHYVAGTEIDLGNNLELDVEPYVKSWSQFINVNIRKLFPQDPDFISEKSLAKGLDVSLRYTKPSYRLQLSYSLARVTRSYGDTVYAPNFDRRHNLNVVGTWQPIKGRKDVEVSVRFALGSGLPFTQTQSFYEDVPLNGGIDQNITSVNGGLGIYYGTLQQFNKGRLPYYHRLDVNIRKSFVVSRNCNLEANAGATNVYNRKNLFYIDRVEPGRRINQLPILPYIGLSLQIN